MNIHLRTLLRFGWFVSMLAVPSTVLFGIVFLCEYHPRVLVGILCAGVLCVIYVLAYAEEVSKND